MEKMKRNDKVRRKAAGSVQERLLPFLRDPNSYSHRPRQVRWTQTHASHVFFAGPYVYKVKKPVDFGFLDFSTLEKRRHFCEREVELNRRLAPDMYLGVVPIREARGKFHFDGSGRVVEYAVRMRKLANGRFLDQLVEKDEATAADIDRIVAVLKDFYATQRPTAEIEEWGRVSGLRISTEENFRQMREFVGRTISEAALGAIRGYTERFYAGHARLFAARIWEGRIRDCHGDLHLEHIHVTPKALTIYDCIEFNDRFRHVDVANDAAFLAMDLDYEGRPDLAAQFSRKMASALEDEGLLRLMDFYKCYRACVRGKVESLHSVAPTAPAAERDASAERARKYFRLALNYAVAGSKPMVLVVMGRIASGKSTLSSVLGAELGWEVVSSDRVRKGLAGLPLYGRSGAVSRARLYSAAMTARTYERILAAAKDRAKVGRSTILDATFARRSQREELVGRLEKAGVAWRFLEVEAGDAMVRRRLRQRESAQREVSDARLEDFERLDGAYEPPVELDGSYLVKVRATGAPERMVVKALLGLARLEAGLREGAK